MTAQFGENGKGTPLGYIVPRRPCDPTHVRYRGRVRRVYGVIPARHQRQKHYLLAFPRGRAPENAHQAVIGVRGQAHFTGVVVRADHCRPVRVKAIERKRGRPRVRERRGTD